MSEQYWGCSDEMSEANFSPAETLVTIISSTVQLKSMQLFFFITDTESQKSLISHKYHHILQNLCDYNKKIKYKIYIMQ